MRELQAELTGDARTMRPLVPIRASGFAKRLPKTALEEATAFGYKTGFRRRNPHSVLSNYALSRKTTDQAGSHWDEGLLGEVEPEVLTLKSHEMMVNQMGVARASNKNFAQR